MRLDDERWRQQLREQLLQRSKDDAQVQRRWEKYIHQRRFWPDSIMVNESKKRKQIQTKTEL